MTSEEQFVVLLQNAVKANFAVAREGKSFNALIRYEDSQECPRAMLYGMMTEHLGADYTREYALNLGYTDYDSMMFQYNLLLLSKEPSPKKDDKRMWKRYANKKKLIINYIKLNSK